MKPFMHWEVPYKFPQRKRKCSTAQWCQAHLKLHFPVSASQMSKSDTWMPSCKNVQEQHMDVIFQSFQSYVNFHRCHQNDIFADILCVYWSHFHDWLLLMTSLFGATFSSKPVLFKQYLFLLIICYGYSDSGICTWKSAALKSSTTKLDSCWLYILCFAYRRFCHSHLTLGASACLHPQLWPTPYSMSVSMKQSTWAADDQIQCISWVCQYRVLHRWVLLLQTTWLMASILHKQEPSLWHWSEAVCQNLAALVPPGHWAQMNSQYQ